MNLYCAGTRYWRNIFWANLGHLLRSCNSSTRRKQEKRFGSYLVAGRAISLKHILPTWFFHAIIHGFGPQDLWQFRILSYFTDSHSFDSERTSIPECCFIKMLISTFERQRGSDLAFCSHPRFASVFAGVASALACVARGTRILPKLLQATEPILFSDSTKSGMAEIRVWPGMKAILAH